MSLLKCVDEISLAYDCGVSDFTFDGCYYYFLISAECKIIKTDTCYNIISCYNICKKYNCICYDYDEKCFWLGSSFCNRIYKLNSHFKEIDYITVCVDNNLLGGIIGISYKCCSDTLLAAYAYSIVEINKKNKKVNIKQKDFNEWNSSICCICPYYIVCSIKNNKQYLKIYNYNNEKICTHVLSCEYIIKGILLDPCNNRCGGKVIKILTNKHNCYPYILNFEINLCICKCNYEICQECDDNSCNADDSCEDVIKSVALMETALSHILDAEGKKLQKVLKETNDINEILCINKEINNTIINTIQLEYILYNKLACVLNSCDTSSVC